MKKITHFKDLIGQTLVAISGQVGDDEIVFTLLNGDRYHLYHSQSCCESVEIEDIQGDFNYLLNSPLLQAEEVESGDNPEGVTIEWQDSYTWTFYKLATINGYVTIRWYGSSNGYYSESVDFAKL